MYSSIKRKPCKQEGCNKPPQVGLNGFCYTHCPEEIKSKYKSKKGLQIKSANARKYASTKLRMAKYGKDTERDLWYKARRLEMKGRCIECGGRTNKDNDEFYKWNIAHVVPKSLIPSASTNDNNWIELCVDHHSEFDSTFEKASKMKCFLEAKRKFELFKHLIPAHEMRKINPNFIPDVLLSMKPPTLKDN